MAEHDGLGSKLEEIDSKLEKTKAETTKVINKLIDDINSAFTKNHEYDRRFGEHVARRLDDIEGRLGKIESDMDIVRADMTHVTNWTKTGDKIYDMTRTHAYEIPRIDERVKKLEERDSD